jgi:hypothetical protein
MLALASFAKQTVAKPSKSSSNSNSNSNSYGNGNGKSYKIYL